MSKSASTLSIRLQLPPDDELQKPRPDEVEYLWDRIIIAAVAAAVIVLAVIAGSWYWLAEPETEMTSKTVVSQTPPVQAERVAQAAAVPPATSPALGAAAGSALQIQAADDNPDEAPVAQLNSVEAEPAAASTAMEEELNTTPQVDAAQSQTIEEVHAQQTTAPPAEVEILSDHLVHAQLSTELENREPLNQAAAVIPMNEEGLVTVYLYTELQDLQGETVYYNWYHQDKRVARVRARPQRQLTRAYSSKYIDRFMLGQWRVELSSAEGIELASAEFEVR